MHDQIKIYYTKIEKSIHQVRKESRPVPRLPGVAYQTPKNLRPPSLFSATIIKVMQDAIDHLQDVNKHFSGAQDAVNHRHLLPRQRNQYAQAASIQCHHRRHLA